MLQLAGALLLGLASDFLKGICLVASHKYRFADLLSISGNSAYTLVCCWSVNNLPVFYSIETKLWRKKHPEATPWRFGLEAAEDKQVAVPQPVNGASLEIAWAFIANLGKKHAERLVRRFWCAVCPLGLIRSSQSSSSRNSWLFGTLWLLVRLVLISFCSNTTWVTDEIACLGNLPPPKVGGPLSVMKVLGCSINIEAEPYNLQGQQVMNFELWSKPFVVPQSNLVWKSTWRNGCHTFSAQLVLVNYTCSLPHWGWEVWPGIKMIQTEYRLASVGVWWVLPIFLQRWHTWGPNCLVLGVPPPDFHRFLHTKNTTVQYVSSS